ncbi:uncharacterized protein LTHEOB_5185 [Lasiodiplodia theobromae]|uniref:uncharacterized protein n=1 Tax=Lasiodiplodia theobromae TaxID=45133 RepID=UPI0015C3BC38|nr:uncharacterized protein LTHEOB_5185 [Lasiodiplodia theobromae]KAF4545352.1 hypothetical protein LTHEOB_5185 [Lasiodiplodia theobromae]
MCSTNDSQMTMVEEEEKPLYEEIDPDFEDENGALKTDNPKNNRWQRNFVHVEDKMSKFRKTVQTVLVVHGWKTPERTEPMSLIILSVKLDCQKRNFRFQSARMWLSFGEDCGATPPDGEAAPEVLAYAPFVASQNWNLSDENIENTTATGATLGADQYVHANLELKKEVKRTSTRTYFDRGSADFMVEEDRSHGVVWYLEQNELQKYGVRPEFHLAVLVKRQHDKDGKPIPFSGMFDMRVEAGFIHDFEDARRRFFRGGKPEDEAVYYDPNMEVQTGGRNNAGEKLKSRVKEDNLGELIGGPDGNWLSALIDPTGDLSELVPMKPT